jgi:hypothetical protein
MTEQTKIRRNLSSFVLAAAVACAFAVGCGGAKDASSAAAPRSTTVAKEINRGKRPQPAGDIPSAKNAAITSHNKAACEQAVQSAPSLTAAAKTEIAALCFRMNYIPEDNERTVRAICQEVANASSLSSEAARKRTVSACYEVGMK